MYRRIMIFGRPGSGKSTFAKALGKRLHLPVFYLDSYFFTRNWKERETEEFLQIQQSLIEQPEWIIDGNATSSLEMRYKEADLVLYFSFPRLLCLWRILKRRWMRDRTIPDRAQSCPEILRWRLIKYLWTFDQRVEDKIKRLKSLYPQTPFITISNDKEKRALHIELK